MRRPASRLIWEGVITLATLLIGWRIIALGMAQHYAENGGFDTALAWYPDHPLALRQQAALAADDGDTVYALGGAVDANPAEARVVAQLAQESLQTGDSARADAAMALAARLAPADAELHLSVAAYWLDRGRLDLALSHWDVALRVRPALRDNLFPALLALAAAPVAESVFPGLAAAHPEWWPDFFVYAAEHAVRPDTVERLFNLRRAHGSPGMEERSAYVARLQRGGRWAQAYIAWLSGLDADQRRHAGPLYDGGFETPIADQGFAWHAPRLSGVSVARAFAPGATGTWAVHVMFDDKPVRFAHLYQPLLLGPGRYEISGRVWPNLQANRGLQWQVSCPGRGDPLGTSERFVGVDQWRHFSFEIVVPEDSCEGQELRLVALAERWADYKIKGDVWFDDLEVVRQSSFDSAGHIRSGL